MKVVKAEEKTATFNLTKNYSRIPKVPQKVSQNAQAEQWNTFNKKAAELSSCHGANVLVIAHFPDGNSPLGISYVSTHGRVAHQLQHESLLHLLVNRLAKRCSDAHILAGIRKEDKVSIPENQQVVVAVDSLLDVANQKEISFTQTTNPISLSEQIENVEQHQEEKPFIFRQNDSLAPSTQISDPLPTPPSTNECVGPRIMSLGNIPPAMLKCFTVSQSAGTPSSRCSDTKELSNNNKRIPQTLHLKSKPLDKPAFVSNGQTYAPLNDGSVVKVLPVQFARNRVTVEEQQGVSRIADQADAMAERELSVGSCPKSHSCVDVMMTDQLTEAIEAMNNDVLTFVASQTHVMKEEEIPCVTALRDGASSGCNGVGMSCKKRKGQPRKMPYVHRTDGRRESRNNKANYRFKCDQCARAFRDSFDLKVHIRKHTGEKPFKCDHCDLRFSLKCTLKVHQLLHTGERPFRCDQCDKAFTRSDYLTRHLSSHTGDKPFCCPIPSCNKSFALKGRLNKHQRTFNHFVDPLTRE